MKIKLTLLFLLSFASISVLLPSKSGAIIILAPLILIPLAKLLAIIFAGLAFPFAAIGTFWAKLFKQGIFKALIVVFMLLIIIVIAVGGILLYLHPERPLF